MIPSNLYEQIVKVMPIASVEAIIQNKKSILFMKRNNSPVKNHWWFPGGRIRKGETLKQALIREIKEETGLKIEIIKFVGVYSRIFSNRHDITIVFLCKTENEKVILNNEHSKFQFFLKFPNNLHPYLIKAIADANIIT